MQITPSFSLKPYNTFSIEAFAKYFTEIKTVNDLHKLFSLPEYKQNNHFILGGGSNILLTQNVDALVIKNNLKGVSVVKETDTHVFVKAHAGEVWHDFVMWCINNNYAGIENLSLIPGCVGASPMQNIGAYGVEIKDVFFELEATHLTTGETKIFSKAECEFGYRESVFKHQYKNQFIITSVTFQLSKTPNFHIEYGAIKQELDTMNVSELSIKAISQAVINIRSSKLPNPKEIGNAGSFFKNPEVSLEVYEKLKKDFPALVAYH